MLAEARAFVAVWLDLTSAEGDAELYAQQYAVSAIPAVALFDREGRTAGTLLGARGPEAVVPALRAARALRALTDAE
jgi:predicted hotdog family 3-hydroxylacyl-ACP dehydratase